MNEITDREKKILRLRYGLEVLENVESTAKETYIAIGKELGISRTRVQQLEIEGLNKLGYRGVSYRGENRNDLRRLIKTL